MNVEEALAALRVAVRDQRVKRAIYDAASEAAIIAGNEWEAATNAYRNARDAFDHALAEETNDPQLALEVVR